VLVLSILGLNLYSVLKMFISLCGLFASMVLEILLDIAEKTSVNRGSFPSLGTSPAGGNYGSILDVIMSDGTIMAIFAILAVFGLIYYVYLSVTIMAIAKRTKTGPAWLAWIPIVRNYLVVKIGGVPMWTLALFLVGLIPYLGVPAMSALTAYWFWHVAEKCGKPGWWGILMMVPIVNLVVLGLLAWKK